MNRNSDTARPAIQPLKPYSAYKPSGAKWLGEVPAHWEVRSLASIGAFSKGNGGSRDDEQPFGIPCIRYGDLYTTHQYFFRKSRSYISPKRAGSYTPIRYGDLLFAASGETLDEIGKSAVNLIPSSACCGGDVIVFRPCFGINARYLGYAADCRPSINQKACMGRGFTVFHIYAAQLKRLTVALPPLPEQSAIASFLNHITDQTEQYIFAKEKQVTLLNEQKHAIVQGAVTGRFDVRTGRPFSAYMAFSAKWLDDVPAHWKVRRNGQIFAQRNETGHSELPILEVSLHSGVSVRDFGASNRKQVMSDREMYKRALKGDIAYNMMRMWQGAVGVAPVDGLVSPAYVVAKPLAGNDSRYFNHLFHIRPYMTEVNRYSRGIVKDRNRLYWEDFKQIQTPCPPLDEQVLIANAIDDTVRLTADGVRNLQRQIGMIKEYRARLIADVVTGKLDVRDAAAHLADTSDGLTEGEDKSDSVED